MQDLIEIQFKSKNKNFHILENITNNLVPVKNKIGQ